MRDYPIGSFLFWEVERSRIGDYQFYEFVRDYHERKNRHNSKANVSGEEGITAILDGQQRLSALYIGLKGTYAYKEPRKRWDNDAAFPERKLYLNLLQPCTGDEDLEYDFRFLTALESQEKDADTFWFLVGDILNIKEEGDVNDYLIDHNLNKENAEAFKFANKTLFKLHSAIHRRQIINYYLETDERLDKVLNIFIRVNSGGTPLSYSDLLLSIATAQWEKKDAREEINNLQDSLNGTGDGFNFDRDFILKTCLVLSDIPDIAFKVDNFNRNNMLKIEARWDDIGAALRSAVVLASSFGYGRDTLTSNSALIPVAYYLLNRGIPQNFDIAASHAADRAKILKWLQVTVLKRVFGGQPDTVLRPVRQILSQGHSEFPLQEIADKLKGTSKSLVFNADEIQNLFYYQYGQSYTFSTLALLYPSLDFRHKFHVDHIYPRSFFSRRKLAQKGVPSAKIDSFLGEWNYLANLQLLEGVPNQEKSDVDFKAWFEKVNPTHSERKDFMLKHYIPDIDLSLSNFDMFITERTELMSQRFAQMLTI